MASLLFYAWGSGGDVLFLIAMGIINYFGGIIIFQTRHTSKKHNKLALTLLVTVVIVNAAGLILTKYYNFFGLPFFQSNSSHIPLGISFFTFQAIAYSIDIYKENIKPCYNPLNYLLYFTFFPKLISGPITTYQEIKNELANRTERLQEIRYGLERFFFGLGKKVLLADTLANVANQAFQQQLNTLSTPLAWLGIIAFTLQIYYDFSGYSDMAIGLGQIFGFHLAENFNFPYIASSIGDFWQRWHMSLTRWIKNYIYIPIGGNRKGLLRTLLHTIIIFFLVGLWHGAGWQFIVWGLWFAFFLIIERLLTYAHLPIFPKPVGNIYTMSVVIIGWVFFRSPNVSYAFHYLHVMFSQTTSSLPFSLGSYVNTYNYLILWLAIIFILPISRWINVRKYSKTLAFSFSFGYSLLAVVICILCLITIGRQDIHPPFIYALF